MSSSSDYSYINTRYQYNRVGLVIFLIYYKTTIKNDVHCRNNEKHNISDRESHP